MMYLKSFIKNRTQNYGRCILLLLLIVNLTAHAAIVRLSSVPEFQIGWTIGSEVHAPSWQTWCPTVKLYSELLQIITNQSSSSTISTINVYSCSESGFVGYLIYNIKPIDGVTPSPIIDRVYTDTFANRYSLTCPANTVPSGSYCIDTCNLPLIYNAVISACDSPTNSSKATPDHNWCDGTHQSISFNAGNEVVREADYVGFSSSATAFERTYNSTITAASDNQGQHWRNGLSRSIKMLNGMALAYRAGGKVFTFTNAGSSWSTDADITDKLIELKDTGGNQIGWTYTIDSTGEVESYNARGNLLSVTDRAGLTQTLSYDINNRMITISDALGRALHFSYNASDQIATMTNPAGGVYTYTYSTDGTNNLVTVTHPDSKTKNYLYGNSPGEFVNVSGSPNAGINYLNSLTGLVDENGNRFATYRYDAAGRAYDEELGPSLGQSIEHNKLVYNVDGSDNPTSTLLTDAIGTVRNINFTKILGVVKSTGRSQPAGSGCSAAASNITYDANGNVATRTDFNGNATTYVYDLSRNLETSRTEGLTTTGSATSATRTITTTWHPTWRLPLVVSEYSGATATGTPLKTTSTAYDDKGNIISYTEADPARNKTRTTSINYTYSTAVPGLVLTKVIDGPRTDIADITTYIYYPHDATCTPSTATSTVTNLGCRGQLQSLTDALGHVAQYTRYNHHGQLEQMTDANGVVTTMTYDLRQRLLTRTVAAGTAATATTTYTYDAVGQLIKLTRPDTSTIEYTYDAAHRLTAISDTAGNSVNYTLDSASNITQTDYRNADGTSVKHDTFEYDALGRLEAVIDGGNNLITHAYDPNGNLTKMSDGRNKTTTYTPDSLDRTTTTINALAGNTQNKYNALDQTILVIAPNNAQTSYVVDALNNVTTENSADRGTTTATYDNAGNLNTMSDTRGIVITTTWDALNRPLSTSYPQTGENRTYTWDVGTGCSNGMGRLCQMTDAAGSTKFSYDARGNLLSQTRTEAGSTLITSFSYDTADRLIATSAPTGQPISTQRDSNGRIKQMNATVAGVNTAIVSNIQTDAVGNTTAQTLGNGVSESYTFNLMGYLGQLNSTASSSGSGTGSGTVDVSVPTLPEWLAIIMGGLLLAVNLRYSLKRSHGLALILMIGLTSALIMNPLTIPSAYADTTSLGYDENHNVITRTTPLGTTNYGYDDLNRLNLESGPNKSQNINYDANGNRTSDSSTTYTYTSNTDRLTTINGQTVTMDAAGNITSAHNLSFAWNQAGQLKTVSQSASTGGALLATYYYDYLDRRSRKVTTSAAPQGVTTTLYVYDQANHLLAELRPPNTPLMTYIWKDDVPISVIVHSAAYHDANPTFTSADQAIYLEVDHLNTPRVGRNQTGTIVWRWESDAFGSTVANNDPDGDGKNTVINLRFPGQYFDIESGLHYNHHRYYDPKVGGRYLSSDPIGLAGGVNTFGYVGGNPVSWIDPLGLYHCVGGANCDFTPPMQTSLQCFDACTGRDTSITGGRGNRSRPNSSHARGEACDIGRNANRDLPRDDAERCTLQCFPNGYGQEERNGPRVPGTHYHIQSSTVPGGNPGFSPGVRGYAP